MGFICVVYLKFCQDCTMFNLSVTFMDNYQGDMVKVEPSIASTWQVCMSKLCCGGGLVCYAWSSFPGYDDHAISVRYCRYFTTYNIQHLFLILKL